MLVGSGVFAEAGEQAVLMRGCWLILGARGSPLAPRPSATMTAAATCSARRCSSRTIQHMQLLVGLAVPTEGGYQIAPAAAGWSRGRARGPPPAPTPAATTVVATCLARRCAPWRATR
jgi:hypothetical protein